MNKIKIAHESPNSIFNTVQKHTDYDYALVHLLEGNEEYAKNFQRGCALPQSMKREVILDNSIFELGKAFDSHRFADWVHQIRPTWYIVPDVLENCLGTLEQMREWNVKYPKVHSSKKIGVVQGSTYVELKHCYKQLDQTYDVDMIAISFDYSYYERLCPHPNVHVSRMLGRVGLLGRLVSEGVINPKKPHHLLGTSLPQEGLYYRHSNYDWIYSMDTSNPVVHGIKRIGYTNQGLWNKESQKLHELVNEDIAPDQLDTILQNVKQFRSFWNHTA